MAKKQNDHICSFCGKTGNQVKKMIAGPNIYICNECIHVCSRILEEEEEAGEQSFLKAEDIPKPQELKAYLDEYVVGQETAKRTLAVAVYNHYKRVAHSAQLEEEGAELQKSNILMIGPTGTGKTLLASTLARKLKVPFAIADATTLTEAGYVGEDVENILLKLIQNAGNNIKKAERGIIYIDEIDKIARKSENVSITRDVSGEGVQQALLKIIEGTQASVPPQGGRKHPNQEMLKIETKDILVICGGAFVDLEKIIQRRVSQNTLGFDAGHRSGGSQENLDELYSRVHPDDFVHFGLIPEFIGRLPINVSLNVLSREDLKRVITEPRNSIIKQYETLLKLDGIELCFEEDAIDAIADRSIRQKTGARGIRSIVENSMRNIMFDLPSLEGTKKVIVTEKVITEGTDPVVLTGQNSDQTWDKALYESDSKTSA